MIDDDPVIKGGNADLSPLEFNDDPSRKGIVIREIRIESKIRRRDRGTSNRTFNDLSRQEENAEL